MLVKLDGLFFKNNIVLMQAEVWITILCVLLDVPVSLKVNLLPMIQSETNILQEVSELVVITWLVKL